MSLTNQSVMQQTPEKKSACLYKKFLYVSKNRIPYFFGTQKTFFVSPLLNSQIKPRNSSIHRHALYHSYMN
jgi:hypothetical protein